MSLVFKANHDVFWDSLIKEGQLIRVNKDEEIPASVRQFFDEANEKVSKGVEEDRKKAENQATVDLLNEKKELWKQLEAGGRAIDKRWSVTRLIHEIGLMKRGMTETKE